jgi:hypothetical protein
MAALGVACCVAACSRGPAAKPGGQDAGIRRETERGPVKVVVSADRVELTMAQRLKLRIEATAEEGVEVTLPAFGENLESFGIVDYATSQPELIEGNRTRQSRTYELEPFLSGEYTIPSMKVTFRRQDEADKTHELETEDLTIKVTSLLPEDLEDLAIRDELNPVELPRPPLPWLWIGGGALVLLLAGAAVMLVVRRGRRGKPAAREAVPPHETAFRRLEALVAEELVEQGRIKEFYQGVSGILRTYIEDRFGLHAPEQTTEEFLPAVRHARELTAEHVALLEEFLKHCDMVKFAEFQPSTADIQRTFDSCKGFIEGTKQTVQGLRDV